MSAARLTLTDWALVAAIAIAWLAWLLLIGWWAVWFMDDDGPAA